MNIPSNKGGRPRKRSGAEPYTNNLKVSAVAATILTQQVAKLGVSKGEYVSAAIEYFAKHGLDPTKQTGAPEGTLTRQFLNDSIMQGRQEHMDVGNRIVKIMRVWERDLYKFLVSNQTSLVHYLERIEASILNQLLVMESRALSTILEHTVSTEIQAHMTRVLTERITAKVFGETENGRETTKRFDTEHDRRLLQVLKELMKITVVTRPPVATKATPIPIPEPPAKTKPSAAGTETKA